MSTATLNQTQIAQDRGVEATKQLCQSLGLKDLKPAELRLLAIALSEAVSSEIPHNVALAEKIKDIFTQLQPIPKVRQLKTKFHSPSEELSKLNRQTKVDNSKFSPYVTLDPIAIYEMVGKEQFSSALSTLSLATLKKMIASLPNDKNQKKPGSKANKEQVIEYLSDQVADL